MRTWEGGCGITCRQFGVHGICRACNCPARRAPCEGWPASVSCAVSVQGAQQPVHGCPSSSSHRFNLSNTKYICSLGRAVALTWLVGCACRYVAASLGRPIRFVGLSTALANAHDLADWLGCPASGLFNFKPSVRPVPLEAHMQGYPGEGLTTVTVVIVVCF